MITLFVLAYAYIVWLFTAVNPMPHLGADTVFLSMLEILAEMAFICFCIVIYIAYKGEIDKKKKG